LIVNAVTLNGGDAAVMLAIREHVRKALGADAEITVTDQMAVPAAARYSEVEFSIPLAAAILRHPHVRYLDRLVRDLDCARWLLAARVRPRARWLSDLLLRPLERRKLAQYADADVVISTGGTYLVEQYPLWPRLFELRACLALGTPLVLYTQSLGPFRWPANRRSMRTILTGANLVLLRDERSLEHVRELCADGGHVHVAADAAFTFAEPAGPMTPPDSPRRVAISVRHWPYFARTDGDARYVEALRRLTTHLVRDRQVAVTFVSTCQGILEYWTDDSAKATRLVEGLPEDVRRQVTVDEEFRKPPALIELLRTFDLVVATRMHLAILALCANVPVLAIAYEFKTRELFDRLGLGDHVRSIDDLEGDVMIDAFERFWHERGSWAATLPAGVQAERRLADSAIELLEQVPTSQGPLGEMSLSPTAREARRRNLTYLRPRRLRALESCARKVDREGVPGDFLEAGVALGGSAVVLASLMGEGRSFHGYDVFAMIPPPGDDDPPEVHQRYATIEAGESAGIGGDLYYGYRDDLLGHVTRTFAEFGMPVGDRVHLHEGLFEDTLHPAGPVALAHIDSDWFEPVDISLRRIGPNLSPGGFMVLDDYHDYEGCRDATDRFVAGGSGRFTLIELDGNVAVWRRRTSGSESRWRFSPRRR
jgi:colanic acid/amylovoran biosynthesis protein